MSDLTNAIQHSRGRRPGYIDPNGVYVSSLVTGLLGYWKLDEASGARADSLGLHDMTVNNTVTQAVGKVGNAMEVATGGVNGLVAANTGLTGGGARSVSLWCYPTNVSAQRGIASAANVAASNSPLFMIVLRKGGGTGPFSVYHGAAYRDGTTVAQLNTWYNLVYTFTPTGNAVQLWVNGTREVNVSAGDSNTAVNFYLGASFGDYAGRIDEAGAWNRVLTDAEIAQLYNSGNGVTYPLFI